MHKEARTYDGYTLLYHDADDSHGSVASFLEFTTLGLWSETKKKKTSYVSKKKLILFFNFFFVEFNLSNLSVIDGLCSNYILYHNELKKIAKFWENVKQENLKKFLIHGCNEKFLEWCSNIRMRKIKNEDFGGKVDYWMLLAVYLVHEHEIAATVSICQLLHSAVSFVNRLTHVLKKIEYSWRKNTPTHTITSNSNALMHAKSVAFTALRFRKRYNCYLSWIWSEPRPNLQRSWVTLSQTITMFTARTNVHKMWRGKFSAGRPRKWSPLMDLAIVTIVKKRSQDLLQTNPEGIGAHRQSYQPHRAPRCDRWGAQGDGAHAQKENTR